MAQKIVLLLVCFINLSLYTSEKKPKDIYSLNDLKTEVARIRKEYNQHKDASLNDLMTKRNRINHNTDPAPQQPINQTEHHT